MDRFYLIIQITTTGLQTEYHSPGIDPQDDEIQKTITDERAHVTQISRDSDVYSIQITKNYRVYSLIVTDTDKFGRSGFYELKLYGPGNYPIDNFIVVLQTIKEIYNQTKSKEEYDAILSSILVTENNKEEEFIVINQLLNKDHFIYFEENKIEFLKTTFKDKGVYLSNKVYALDKNKAAGENTVLNVGLEPFDTVRYKIVEIHNPYNVLKDVWVNNIVLKSRGYNHKQQLLLNQEDILTYSTTDDDRVQMLVGNILNVQRKPQPQNVIQHSPYTSQRKKSFFKENGVYLLALIIMISAVGFGYYKDPTFLGLLPTNPTVGEMPEELKNENENSVKDSIPKLFRKSIVENNPQFVPIREGLNHYTFSIISDKWQFKNSKSPNVYKDFDLTVVAKLDVKDSLPFNSEEQIKFIAALEKESGKKLDSIKAEENKVQTENTSSSSQKSLKVTPEKSTKEVQKDDTEKAINPLGNVNTKKEGN